MKLKRTTDLASFFRSNAKLLIRTLIGLIFMILSVIIPVSLKMRSSRKSTDISQVSVESDKAVAGGSRDYPQTYTISMLATSKPTNSPLFADTLSQPDQAYIAFDDDTVSNSKEDSWASRPVGPEFSFLRQSSTPSFQPSSHPSSQPSLIPTLSPSINITFLPGLLDHEEHGLLLSSGLTARILARSGQKVQYNNFTYGTESDVVFHEMPDFGATFKDTRPDNPGGWVYVSNSEMKDKGEGSVGSITFDPHGNILKFEQPLLGSTHNCGGGRTPWDTWISCEETNGGINWQVDPMNIRPALPITLGMEGGFFESFSFDVRDKNRPKFFVTEDAERGALQKFEPNPVNVTWDFEPWNMLHAPGTIEYLVLHPNSAMTGGTFTWSSSRDAGRDNAHEFYPNSEGIDVQDSRLYFVCKKIKQLFELDLDNGTYNNKSTTSGLFDGGPDQLQRILHSGAEEYLFFTEEGGKDAGIHGRDITGMFFTVLESSVYEDETTGLAFSPDALHLYVAYQKNGILFDVTRTDGLPFHATSLNVKYHANT